MLVEDPVAVPICPLYPGITAGYMPEAALLEFPGKEKGLAMEWSQGGGPDPVFSAELPDHQLAVRDDLDSPEATYPCVPESVYDGIVFRAVVGAIPEISAVPGDEPPFPDEQVRICGRARIPPRSSVRIADQLCHGLTMPALPGLSPS
jgi:hypothetical protein